MPLRIISICAVLSGLLLSACTPLSLPEPTLTSFSPTATPDLLTDWPPDKSTEVAIIETLLAQTPTAISTPAHELGIIEGVAPPFNTEIFWSGGNQWNGYVNNIFTVALAGAHGNDHRQGVVIVLTKTSEKWIDAPEKTGVLRISAFDDDALTLTSKEGSAYRLELNTQTLSLLTPYP